mmetsp:Transcript_1431/g.5274  ORF Transcript_1431/g.5274 Transcript_1431/m.5274 type:complete len:415 (+) Transcript_1431:1439-2683(+)
MVSRGRRRRSGRGGRSACVAAAAAAAAAAGRRRLHRRLPVRLLRGVLEHCRRRFGALAVVLRSFSSSTTARRRLKPPTRLPPLRSVCPVIVVSHRFVLLLDRPNFVAVVCNKPRNAPEKSFARASVVSLLAPVPLVLQQLHGRLSVVRHDKPDVARLDDVVSARVEHELHILPFPAVNAEPKQRDVVVRLEDGLDRLEETHSLKRCERLNFVNLLPLPVAVLLDPGGIEERGVEGAGADEVGDESAKALAHAVLREKRQLELIHADDVVVGDVDGEQVRAVRALDQLHVDIHPRVHALHRNGAHHRQSVLLVHICVLPVREHVARHSHVRTCALEVALVEGVAFDVRDSLLFRVHEEEFFELRRRFLGCEEHDFGAVHAVILVEELADEGVHGLHVSIAGDDDVPFLVANPEGS